MEFQNNPNSSPRPGQQSRMHNSAADIKELFFFLWRLRLWILASIGICMVIAFVYVRFRTPLYQRSARILLTSKTNTTSEMSVLSDLTGIKTSSNIANEVFILRSPRLMEKVVNDLGLNIRYYSKFVPHTPDPNAFFRKYFSIKTYEFYKDSPFTMEVIMDPLYPAQSLPKNMRFDIVNAGDGGFYFQDPMTPIEYQSDSTILHHYGDTIAFRGFSIILNAKVHSYLKEGTKYYATWTKSEVIGARIANQLKAYIEEGFLKSNTSIKTDIITLYLADSKPGRAEDILNTLIFEYNRETLRYKNASVLNTIEFIDNRLKVIGRELKKVESRYRNYQTRRSLVNLSVQSQMALSSDMDYENQLSEIRLQSSILEMIKEGMDSMKPGEYKVIPSDIGLSDASLGTVISAYNKMVSDRNRMVANSSEINPRVRDLNRQLEDGKNSILISIDNLEKVYIIRENEILNNLNKNKSRMSDIPEQQFDISQIERKQQIIEPLYLLLQQKKEEAQISIYSSTDSARVIEDASGSDKPIEPRKRKIYMLAFFFGLCIPPGVVIVLNVFRMTVIGRDDISKVLDVPVIATIPQTRDTSVEWSGSARDLKSESFRMLRSSLQFFSGNVIQVTSSTRDEGKSFIASNLAVAIAHSGKKVVLVGLDLRKPVLVHRFPGMQADKANSVVGYLIGKCDEPSLTLRTWEKYPNMSIAFSGSVPPNPTELLDSDRLGTLIGWMKEHFDYVIIDSAPMLPVSDSVLINRYVDNTLYIIRSEYTGLKVLPDIKLLFEQSHIKSPKFILNCVDLSSKVFKYGYGSGYGYGYGYGYGGYGYGHGYCYGYGYSYESSDSRKKRHRYHLHRHRNDSEKGQTASQA